MRSKSTPRRSGEVATSSKTKKRPVRRRKRAHMKDPDEDKEESTSRSSAECQTSSVDGETMESDMATPAKRTKQPDGKDSGEEDETADTEKKLDRKYRWKTWERDIFYTALKNGDKCIGKYPEKDIELCEEIFEQYPAKQREFKFEDVQNLIKMFTIRAKQKLVATCKPIDKWLELMDALSNEDKNMGQVLSLVMMTAKQEPTQDLPAPASFDPDLPQPDYASLYNYFACAFSDKPLPELSPIDSLVVEDFMQSLCFQIECLNDQELRRSLRKAYLHMAQEPSEEVEADQDDMKNHLSRVATIINPLGLNALKIIPVVPK